MKIALNSKKIVEWLRHYQWSKFTVSLSVHEGRDTLHKLKIRLQFSLIFFNSPSMGLRIGAPAAAVIRHCNSMLTCAPTVSELSAPPFKLFFYQRQQQTKTSFVRTG
jgi:hypothetical protein